MALPQGCSEEPAGRLALTVLIPTHNRPVLLLRAVSSALADLPPRAEVLVVDDASDVAAAQTLADLMAQDNRLHVLSNAGTRGAAGARNFGVDMAQGAIIMFLDDDDELLPGYAARVLQVAGRQDVDYGFCAILRRDNTGQEERIGRRYRRGQIPSSAALRHKIAALSAGFWIRRVRFLETGGLDPAQKLDEDTSLCCALVAAGSLPWYEDEPGMRVHILHTSADSGGAQLTQISRPDIVLDCYLRTWTGHEARFPAFSEARWFLGTRYLRRAAKLGKGDRVWRFVGDVRPRVMALAFAAYGAAKILTSKGKSLSPVRAERPQGTSRSE